MNKGWTYCDRISSQSAGQTVLAYYTQRYRHSSQQDWQVRIQQQQILLNGRPTDAQTVLQPGSQLSYRRLPWQEPDVPLNFDVLHEDDHLWVIAKPSGLPVLPGGGFLENTLLHQLRLRYPHENPVPVHRLGRGTSGAVLIAKSQRARDALSRQFRSRTAAGQMAQTAAIATPDPAPTLTKTYRALIGPVSALELSARFTCTYPIGKLPHYRLGYIYGYAPGGLPARSDCTVLRRSPTSTLLQVSIFTGRPHQIRIHLAAAGYPLLGDPLYPAGGVPTPDCAAKPGDVGYWLHAHQLRFIHPSSGQPVSVTAPPPDALMLG